MTDDIVAALDRWRTTVRTAENADEFVPIDELLCRARDEIVALREERQRMSEGMVQAIVEKRLISETHNDALEEAATACLRKARDYVIPIGQDNYHDGCVSCAAAIRALKGQPKE